MRFTSLTTAGETIDRWVQTQVVPDLSKSPIVLFVASDEPALRAFGLHKKWGRDAAGDVEKLV